MANHHETQRTVAKTTSLSFTWNVEGFDALRKMAKLKALPSKDRLFSPEFGNKEAGMWKVALFPFGDREAQKHVSLYLFGDQKARRVAEFSMVILDAEFKELTETFLGEEPTLFTAESNSWGWHEFLSVENDEEMKPYLVESDTFRVKISIKVYTGVSEDESPRMLFNIVQHRCSHSEPESDDESPQSYPDGVHTSDPNIYQSGNSLPLEISESTIPTSRGRNVRAESCSGREIASRHIHRSFYPGAENVAPRNRVADESSTREYDSLRRVGRMVTCGAKRNSDFRRTRTGMQSLESSCMLREVYTVAGRRQGFSRCRRRATLAALQEQEPGSKAEPYMKSAGSTKGAFPRRLSRSSYCCCSTSHQLGVNAPRKPFASCSNNAIGDPPQLKKLEMNIRGQSLQSDIAAFALNPKVLDLTVICEGLKFKANRFVLGARSAVFAAMLYGHFSEAKLEEIDIQDVSSDCVDQFLTFIATDTCPALELPLNCSCGCGGERSETVCNRGKCSGCVVGRDVVHVAPQLLKLMAAADKYQVNELYSRCVQALARCVCAESVIDILEGAEALNCIPLIDACQYYLKLNSNKIDKIVNTARWRFGESVESLEKNKKNADEWSDNKWCEETDGCEDPSCMWMSTRVDGNTSPSN